MTMFVFGYIVGLFSGGCLVVVAVRLLNDFHPFR